MCYPNRTSPAATRTANWGKYVFVMVAFLCVCTVYGCADTLVCRDSLIADVRQLGDIIESVHPDPYRNVSGRREWERNLLEIISRIPESGMSSEEFYFLLCPIVTSLGDAHTWLRAPDVFSYGLPLYFGAVSDGMFVGGVPSEDYRDLLGARLISIQGVPAREIVRRAYSYVSAENDFQILRNLSGTGMLFNKWMLDHLIPECQGKSNIKVALLQKDGTEVVKLLECGKYTDFNSYIWSTSRFSLPSRERSDFVYSFIDTSKQTMLLIIDDLNTYREAFEMWKEEGRFNDCRNDASDLYRRYNASTSPVEEEALISGLPSATEMFGSMCREMKQAGTRTLIVDLRRNGGGNSAMAEILTYFLYGKEQLLEIESDQIEVLRCSPLYLERHPGVNIGEISLLPGVVIDSGNYEFDPLVHMGAELDRETVHGQFEGWAKSMPTFYSEYSSGEHGRYYLPENVFVLSSVGTFSSGFTVMYYLYRAGAKGVGVPSAQAGNCFGETLDFELKNSKLYFTVSCKYYEKFPGDTTRGRVLMPDYPLTYEILRSYNFDRNASLMYALDLAGQGRYGGK